MMSPLLQTRRHRLLLAAGALFVGSLVVLAAMRTTPTSLVEALAYLLPALLLLAVLVTRRYPGERTLLSLTRRNRSCRSRVGAIGAKGGARPRALVARGGRLIASSLAVRPPPGFASVSLN